MLSLDLYKIVFNFNYILINFKVGNYILYL